MWQRSFLGVILGWLIEGLEIADRADRTLARATTANLLLTILIRNNLACFVSSTPTNWVFTSFRAISLLLSSKNKENYTQELK
jgi:hypothetical protein